MLSVGIRPMQVFLLAPQMVCWGLERLVQTAHPRMELLGSDSTLEASAARWEAIQPDVVVVDFEDDLGLDWIAKLPLRPPTRLLLLSGSHDVELLDRAILAGARGVVRKTDPPQILLKAIEKVHEGELWIDRCATGRIFLEMARQKAAQGNDPEKTKIATLTSRERQTIAAVASDASAPAKVIARRLCISEHTLRNHLTSIYSKLELSSRLDLYAYATRHHLNEMR
jgi:two-component system, NarL family, nitrate/nitrite response regulator NarL